MQVNAFAIHGLLESSPKIANGRKVMDGHWKFLGGGGS